MVLGTNTDHVSCVERTVPQNAELEASSAKSKLRHRPNVTDLRADFTAWSDALFHIRELHLVLAMFPCRSTQQIHSQAAASWTGKQKSV